MWEIVKIKPFQPFTLKMSPAELQDEIEFFNEFIDDSVANVQRLPGPKVKGFRWLVEGGYAVIFFDLLDYGRRVQIIGAEYRSGTLDEGMRQENLIKGCDHIQEFVNRLQMKKERLTDVTANTTNNFYLFKAIKEEMPELTQKRVAIEANRREGVSHYTENSVRNAYKAMGKKWLRGKRSR